MSTISTIIIRRGPAGADGAQGQDGAAGAAGATGATGPAPAGTGFVKVSGGVLTTPSATIPSTDIAGIGTAATADVSTTGGASKVLQLDANGNLYLAPLVNHSIAAAEEGGPTGEDGNLILRNAKFVGWFSADANGGDTGYVTGAGNEYAKIRWDANHGGGSSPEWNFDSSGRICFYWKGGMQFGNAQGGTHYIYLHSGYASAGTTTRQSVPFALNTATWTSGAHLDNQLAIQAAPLDLSGTNSAFHFYRNTTLGSAQEISGTRFATIAPEGIWSAGTAPTFVTLTDGATITQTCSIYKNVQAAKITLGGNRTLAISGAVAGMRGVIYVSQDTTGSRTLTLPTGSVKQSGFALSTAIELTDRLEWEYDGANYFWTITNGFSTAYAATDADAIAYIAAVEAAKGSTITGAQESAIDSFVIAEKAASRWTSLTRIFLPIWANASANAIDMKTLATGTFANSPTHAAGYIQGNGSTQYFDTGITASAAGNTTTAAGYTTILTANTTANASPFGTTEGANQCSAYFGSTSFDWKVGQATLNSAIANTDRIGVVSLNRIGTTQAAYRRKASGFTTLGSSTVATAGTIGSTYNVYLMAGNSAGTAVNHWNGRIGGFVMHSPFDSTASEAFTLSLKTLWETCTGSALP